MNINHLLGLNNYQKDDIITQIVQCMSRQKEFSLNHVFFTLSTDEYYDLEYIKEEDEGNFFGDEILSFLDNEDGEERKKLELALIMFFLDSGVKYWEKSNYSIENWNRCRKKRRGVLVSSEQTYHFSRYYEVLSTCNETRIEIETVYLAIMEQYNKQVHIIISNKETGDVIKQVDRNYQLCEYNIFCAQIEISDICNHLCEKDYTTIDIQPRIKPQVIEKSIQPAKWINYNKEIKFNKYNAILCVNINEQLKATTIGILQQNERFSTWEDIILFSNKVKSIAIVYPFYAEGKIRQLKEELSETGYNIIKMFSRKDILTSYYNIQNMDGVSILCDVNLEYTSISLYCSGREEINVNRKYDKYCNPIVCFEQLLRYKISCASKMSYDQIEFENESLINDFLQIYLCFFQQSETNTNYVCDFSNITVYVEYEEIKEILIKCYKFVDDFISELIASYSHSKNSDLLIENIVLSGNIANCCELKKIIDRRSFEKCYYSELDEYVCGLLDVMEKDKDKTIKKGYDFCLWSKDFLGEDILLTVISKEGEIEKLKFDVRQVKVPFSLIFFQKDKNYLSDIFPYDENLAKKVLKIRVDNLPDFVEADYLQISAKPDMPLEKCIEVAYCTGGSLITLKYEVIT